MLVTLKDIPYDARAPKPLPGIAPCPMDAWLYPASDYTAQMRARQDILARHRHDTLYYGDQTHDACRELLAHVLSFLNARSDFTVEVDTVLCPDNRHVIIDQDHPLETINKLIQEDVCIMMKQGEGYHLRAALLCFPAAWTLREKIEKPLTHIHAPVADYDAQLAKRVDRLFDGIRAGRPLWRDNRLFYNAPDLYYPFTEANPRPPAGENPRYLRSERQVLYRLPKSQAVAFLLRTFVVDLHTL